MSKEDSRTSERLVGLLKKAGRGVRSLLGSNSGEVTLEDAQDWLLKMRSDMAEHQPTEKLDSERLAEIRESVGQIIAQINDKILAREMGSSLTRIQQEFFHKLEKILFQQEDAEDPFRMGEIRRELHFTEEDNNIYRFVIERLLSREDFGREKSLSAQAFAVGRKLAMRRIVIDYDFNGRFPVRVVAEARINQEPQKGVVATDIMIFEQPLTPENFDELMHTQIEMVGREEVFPSGLKVDQNYFPWGTVIIEGRALYLWGAVLSQNEFDEPRLQRAKKVPTAKLRQAHSQV